MTKVAGVDIAPTVCFGEAEGRKPVQIDVINVVDVPLDRTFSNHGCDLTRLDLFKQNRSAAPAEWGQSPTGTSQLRVLWRLFRIALIKAYSLLVRDIVTIAGDWPSPANVVGIGHRGFLPDGALKSPR